MRRPWSAWRGASAGTGGSNVTSGGSEAVEIREGGGVRSRPISSGRFLPRRSPRRGAAPPVTAVEAVATACFRVRLAARRPTDAGRGRVQAGGRGQLEAAARRARRWPAACASARRNGPRSTARRRSDQGPRRGLRTGRESPAGGRQSTDGDHGSLRGPTPFPPPMPDGGGRTAR